MDQAQASAFSRLPSAISRISQDLLWSVFSFIADMDSPLEYDIFLDQDLTLNLALDDIINASQVCRSWRYLLLRSPSIWGSVLRLDRLNQFEDVWRDEIVRRAGNAPLCVKGRVRAGNLDDSFAVELISQNWSRMRKFDARFGRDVPRLSTLWKTFFRPAPLLVTFRFLFEDRRSKIFSGHNGTFFAGSAPLLQEFSAKAVAFSLVAPWATQLRRLRLEEGYFGVNEILNVVKEMPFLEHLGLHYMPPGSSAIPLPPEESISLPNLVDLQLTVRLELGLSFAYAIKPSNHCTLVWASIGIATGALDPDDLIAIHRVLKRYSRTYFTGRKPAFLYLKLNGNHFESSVMIYTNSSHPDVFVERPPDGSIFYINLTSPFFAPRATLSFLLCFSDLDLSIIKRFDFRPVPSSWPLGPGDDWSEFTSFLKALKSVETLLTSDYGVTVLQQCPQDKQTLPSLRRWELSEANSEDAVRAFLTARRELGLPILVLDLSTSQVGDWGSLEEFRGMKAVWSLDGTEIEYVCGTGEPERLNFGYQRALDEAWQAAFDDT